MFFNKFCQWFKSLWGRMLLAGLPLGVIAFLCLRRSSRLEDLWWIPSWLARWADRHGCLDNIPAFALLAFILSVVFGRRTGSVIAVALALGLEYAQLFIPTRCFDWRDILSSELGVILSLGICWLLIRVWPASRRLFDRSP